MTQPITPAQATEHLKEIPAAVFEVINALILSNIEGRVANVGQSEIVKELIKKGLKKGEIFENKWLDVEPHYRKAGWKVEYDKPGFNEDYEASFTFTAKAKRS